MPISGISDVRRLPREGKIRLGRKVKKGNTEYPTQTPYFIIEDERLKAVYGTEPTVLDIMFPANDTEVIFPQYYKNYGQTGLKCKGDGQTAMYMDHGRLIEKVCTPGAPECAGCKPVATLNVLLYKVPGMGVWQINTSSWNSIVNLNSCIDMIKTMTGGRIAFIPLKLSLDPHTATVRTQDKQFQKQVYVMTLKIDETMSDFYNKYAYLPDTSPRGLYLQSVQNKFAAIGQRVQQHNPALIEPSPQIVFDAEDDEEFEEVVETDQSVQPSVEQLVCSVCGTKVSEKVAEYSQEKYKKILCMKCQRQQPEA